RAAPKSNSTAATVPQRRASERVNNMGSPGGYREGVTGRKLRGVGLTANVGDAGGAVKDGRDGRAGRPRAARPPRRTGAADSGRGGRDNVRLTVRHPGDGGSGEDGVAAVRGRGPGGPGLSERVVPVAATARGARRARTPHPVPDPRTGTAPACDRSGRAAAA